MFIQTSQITATKHNSDLKLRQMMDQNIVDLLSMAILVTRL
jgi:hypothetical protein